MIDIKGLNKKFGNFEVLKNISLTLDKGMCVALIGPNGCGKTTLIKSILGMVLPQSGEILVDGTSVKNSVNYRRQIGYMPQIGRYPANMTIGHTIDMMKELRNDHTDYDIFLYDQFKIRDLTQKKMKTLSGGTTQKVSATLAFLFNPDILILDEPTAGLDPLASEILKDKITDSRNNGKLVIITSHILSELDDLITHLIFMNEGEIVFFKTVDDLFGQTGENRISRAVTTILKQNRDAQDN